MYEKIKNGRTLHDRAYKISRALYNSRGGDLDPDLFGPARRRRIDRAGEIRSGYNSRNDRVIKNNNNNCARMENKKKKLRYFVSFYIKRQRTRRPRVEKPRPRYLPYSLYNNIL